jgi:SAM-dependent methyltransferase
MVIRRYDAGNDVCPYYTLSQESKMNLIELVSRTPRPVPWTEGDNIPWHEPGFSQRMLREHLSQDHDAASRRQATIEKHVNWIHTQVLDRRAASVLDLGCGPGLYASRLARLGHTVTGIDYSPASIAYAREQAAAENLNCTFVHSDIRQADFGSGHDLAMLIYGELNVFRRPDAEAILRKVRAALKPGGSLLLEPHTFEAVRDLGQEATSWYTASTGLFAEQPHLVLQENFWDAEPQVATMRYFIVDAATGSFTRHASSMQAYDLDGYRALLTGCGFQDIVIYEALGNVPQKGLMAILAQ